MMSQVELWKMQDYCESRNRVKRGRRVFNIWNVMFLLVGIVMVTLSACLLTYVSIVGIEMTGMMFIAAGVMGILLGIGVIRISSWKL